jgi:hypothetical protein
MSVRQPRSSTSMLLVLTPATAGPESFAATKGSTVTSPPA